MDEKDLVRLLRATVRSALFFVLIGYFMFGLAVLASPESTQLIVDHADSRVFWFAMSLSVMKVVGIRCLQEWAWRLMIAVILADGYFLFIIPEFPMIGIGVFIIAVTWMHYGIILALTSTTSLKKHFTLQSITGYGE